MSANIGRVSIYCGEVGCCFWIYSFGDASDEAWAALMRSSDQFHERLVQTRERGCAITFTWRAAPPNAPRRKQIADAINASGELFAFHALATDSRAIQMVLESRSWLTKQPFVEKAFANPETALYWLNERMPIDRAGILAAMRRVVPGEERDPTIDRLATQFGVRD